MFVELSAEIAADVETPSCDENCCVLVALGSEHADGEDMEKWVEKGRVETVRRVRGKMYRSASPVANVAYKVKHYLIGVEPRQKRVISLIISFLNSDRKHNSDLNYKANPGPRPKFLFHPYARALSAAVKKLSEHRLLLIEN
jgi:hypothetical protein